MRSPSYLLAQNRRFAANLQNQIDNIQEQAVSFEKRLELYQSRVDDLIGTSGVTEIELAGLQVSVDQYMAPDDVFSQLELTFDALIDELEASDPSDAEFDRYMDAVEASNTQIRGLLHQLESSRVLVAALNAKTLAAYELLSSKLGTMTVRGWKLHLDLQALMHSLSLFLRKVIVGARNTEESARHPAKAS